MRGTFSISMLSMLRNSLPCHLTVRDEPRRFTVAPSAVGCKLILAGRYVVGREPFTRAARPTSGLVSPSMTLRTRGALRIVHPFLVRTADDAIGQHD